MTAIYTPSLRQRVTDALPEPAVAARHQCNRAVEVHDLPPGYGCAVASQRIPVSADCLLRDPRRGQAIDREDHQSFEDREFRSETHAAQGVRCRAMPALGPIPLKKSCLKSFW